MTEDKFTFKFSPQNRRGSIHDYFGRVTFGDPLIASDLLRFYTEPVIAEYVDLDNLQAAPAQFFGPTHLVTGPKEVKLDVPYIAHLHDKEWKSEVLIIAEHKSSPSQAIPLQLAVQAILSLYKRWTDAGRPASFRNFRLPITLMVLVYCGAEDWVDEIRFQDIYPFIPEPLRQFVLQFRLIVINLRRFSYDNLPGRPETQAVVETMKRAFDETLAEHLPGVLSRFEAVPLDDRILDLTTTIAWYGSCVADIEQERIAELVTNVIKGKKGVIMSKTIRRGVFSEGVALGLARGKAEGKVLAILEVRFNKIPKRIEKSIRSMVDLVALQSLAEHAKTCKSLDEFAEALR